MDPLTNLGRWIVYVGLLLVAIGGILPENAGALIEAGADFVAVSAGVWQHPDGPAAAIRAFDLVLAGAGFESG